MTARGDSVRRTETAPAPGFQHGLIPRLRGLIPGLVSSKQRVARAIVSQPDKISQWTISELASRAETSETTVLRLCRDLGLRGYRELRIALAAESGWAAAHQEDQAGSDIAPSDSLAAVVRTITQADSAAVLETGDILDVDAVQQAIDAIAAARRIDIFGVGASGFVGLDLQQKLHRIGLICFSWPDQHAALTATALLKPGDVTIGISHTGETLDTVDIVRRAHDAGAHTIAITSSPLSHLASSVDTTLITASRETTFRSGAMASRIAALTVVDVLFVGVAQQRYDEALADVEATRNAVAHRRFRSKAGIE